MNNENISQGLLDLVQGLNFYGFFLLFIGIFCIWLVNKLIERAGKKLMQKVPARRFIVLQITTLLGFSLYIVGTTVLVINVFNPPKEFMIAAAGSAAVAMGFALKDIAASLIGGLLLLFDRPFQVGDRVSYQDTYGEVISIGLRTVRIQTLGNDMVTIPNSRFITDTVASGNAGEANMTITIDFHFAVHADLAKAKALVDEVVVTCRYAYLKKPRSFNFSEVIIGEGLAIRLRCRANVIDTRYESAFESDIVFRASQLFNQHGIPRPQRYIPQASS